MQNGKVGVLVDGFAWLSIKAEEELHQEQLDQKSFYNVNVYSMLI